MEDSGYLSNTTMVLSDCESTRSDSEHVPAQHNAPPARSSDGSVDSNPRLMAAHVGREGEDTGADVHSEDGHAVEYEFDEASDHSSHDFSPSRHAPDNEHAADRSHDSHSDNESDDDGSGSESDGSRGSEERTLPRPSLPSVQAHAWDPRKSLKRLGIQSASSVYACVSHVNCGHTMQIATFRTDPPMFELDMKGAHTRQLSDRPRYGIHANHRQRVEDMVLQNYLPTAIYTILLNECSDLRLTNISPADLQRAFTEIPTVTQIQNLRSYKNRTLVYSVQHVNDLFIWIHARLCETEADYIGRDDHELIVLKWFQRDGTIGFEDKCGPI